MGFRRAQDEADYDWAAEIAARRATGTVENGRRSSRSRTARSVLVWRSTRDVWSAVFGFALGSTVPSLTDHEPLMSLGSLLLGSAGAAVVGVIRAVFKARRRGRTGERILRHTATGAPAVELLNHLWQEGHDFLEDPPGRSEYQDWLGAAEAQLARYSPSLAGQWASVADAEQLGAPSTQEIEQRLQLIKTLHRDVADNGITLEELAAAGFPGASPAVAVKDPTSSRRLLSRIGARGS